MKPRHEHGRRGAMLVTLRHALRQSSRLAEHLCGDRLVGGEARALLCRLDAIAQELDGLAQSQAPRPLAENDPLWKDWPAPERPNAVRSRTR